MLWWRGRELSLQAVAESCRPEPTEPATLSCDHIISFLKLFLKFDIFNFFSEKKEKVLRMDLNVNVYLLGE